mmetsp:Transcript_17280/g.31148  ORF Transcript_17280/g.31148 Transcript_17280/m.31148 type:complete len:228 (-) Transcript_17280:149-832(-)
MPTIMDEKTSVKMAPVGGQVAKLASTKAAGGNRARTLAMSARVAASRWSIFLASRAFCSESTVLLPDNVCHDDSEQKEWLLRETSIVRRSGASGGGATSFARQARLPLCPATPSKASGLWPSGTLPSTRTGRMKRSRRAFNWPCSSAGIAELKWTNRNRSHKFLCASITFLRMEANSRHNNTLFRKATSVIPLRLSCSTAKAKLQSSGAKASALSKSCLLGSNVSSI